MAQPNPLSFQPGDPVPRFIARSSNRPSFKFDTLAGRYVVLTFFGSAALEKNQKALAHIHSRTDIFDDQRAIFFGVSITPGDESQGRVQQSIPGFRYFWDFDKEISAAYGALRSDAATSSEPIIYRPFTLVLDPMLRVLHAIPLADAEEHNRLFDAAINALPALEQHAGVPIHAPVLILPRVFEPEFCRELIGLYDTHGGQDSGFMRAVDGKTVTILDHSVKRRADYAMPADHPLRAVIREKLKARLIPEVKKAFDFEITRMERYIVSRYDSDTGGFFSPHRDNTTPGTAHRRFACSMNLNAEDYEGGDLRFPEFGPRTYRAPTGGAVIFSCSLMHEATPVTRGSRYAFLPFFYDDAAAKIREQNAGSVVYEVVDYNTREGDAF